jgi:hypothetical protein
MTTVVLDAAQFDILLSFLVTLSMCISAFIGFSAGWRGE